MLHSLIHKLTAPVQHVKLCSSKRERSIDGPLNFRWNVATSAIVVYCTFSANAVPVIWPQTIFTFDLRLRIASYPSTNLGITSSSLLWWAFVNRYHKWQDALKFGYADSRQCHELQILCLLSLRIQRRKW